jgi:hypothetical protein
MGYILVFVLSFVFFILRSSIVKEYHRDSKILNFMAWATKILAVIVSLVLVPWCIVSVNGKVTDDGFCVIMTQSVAFSYGILASIMVLSILTTVQFVASLKLQCCSKRNVEFTRSARHAIYRNVLLNLVSFATTIICLVLYAHYNNNDQLTPFDNVFSVCLSALDIFVLSVCARLMMVEEKRIRRLRQAMSESCCVFPSSPCCRYCDRSESASMYSSEQQDLHNRQQQRKTNDMSPKATTVRRMRSEEDLENIVNLDSALQTNAPLTTRGYTGSTEGFRGFDTKLPESSEASS